MQRLKDLLWNAWRWLRGWFDRALNWMDKP